MGTLRTPLIGLLFCAVALLPLAILAQDEDYGFYGSDFSWIQDVQPEQPIWGQNTWADPLWNVAEPQTPTPEQGWDYAGFENIDWNIAEPETPAPETGWDYSGFENIEQYAVVPPAELFQPYGSLIDPLFTTPGGEVDWSSLAPWGDTESQDQSWFDFYRTDDALQAQQLEFEAAQQAADEFNRFDSTLWAEQSAWEAQQEQEQGWLDFYRTDDALQAQQLEFEAAQQAAYEFNRSDDALWAEQIEWEARQEREQAYIDATLDAEAAAWQYKGVDELNAGDVEIAQYQERQDRRNAAPSDPNQEAKAGGEAQSQSWFDFYRTDDTLQARQREFDAAELQWKGDDSSTINKNFGWPIDVGRGAEQCIDAGNTKACSKAYVDWTVAQTRFGNTAAPENVAPVQPSVPRLSGNAAEESTVGRLTKDPIFGFFLKTVPDAYDATKEYLAGWYGNTVSGTYDATKERLTGWYDSITNSVAPAPQSGGAFADRFQGENSVWNTDPAAQEALLKEWASRTDVDTRLSTREALAPLGVGLGSGASAPLSEAEQSMFDGALPFGMSMTDGRLEINRDADAQSPQEFEEYKKYNLITEAKRYANTTYPVIVDFGEKAVVLRGEEYGLTGNGIGVVRGNNLGNFNFGWDTTVGQKAENTFVSGFQGYEDEGATARRFLARVDPETNRTVGQDVAKEIGKFESEKSFLGRVGDSIGFGPSTVSVEGFTQSGDKFFAQDLVGPYDKNEPPKEPEKKEILMEVGIVMEPIKIPEPVAPQVVPETPAAPPASASADPLPPADTPESPQSVAPPPEAVEVGRMDVKEIAPPLPDISGADPLPCSLCSKEAETPSPLPMPELVPPEEAPQRETTGTEKKILGDLQEPVTNTPETPAEQDLIDKLKTSGVAAPSAADRREISEIIQGRPKTDVEVNFALDSALIDDRAKTGLSQIGGVLSREEFKGRTIFINGHSDAFGGPEYNLALSQRRAEAIKQYLVNEFNLDPGRIIAVGFGREQLKYPNSPYASGNRRVQIVIAR